MELRILPPLLDRWQTSSFVFFTTPRIRNETTLYSANQRSSKMIDFISYFNKTMRTQSKTMITKINQTSSQIRRGKCLLIFKLRSRSRCTSFDLNQPYLHEPTQNMIDFYALLGINASPTDGINQ